METVYSQQPAGSAAPADWLTLVGRRQLPAPLFPSSGWFGRPWPAGRTWAGLAGPGRLAISCGIVMALS